MANTEITQKQLAAARGVLDAGFKLNELQAAYDQLVAERLSAMISNRRERYADALIDYFDILGVFPNEEKARPKKDRKAELINILTAQERDFLDPEIANKDRFDDVLAEWLGE
jgi:hypothetical protein